MAANLKSLGLNWSCYFSLCEGRNGKIYVDSSHAAVDEALSAGQQPAHQVDNSIAHRLILRQVAQDIEELVGLLVSELVVVAIRTIQVGKPPVAAFFTLQVIFISVVEGGPIGAVSD